ncbi:hypothetical protein GCM10010964_31880 [Caldovatus sediminis]|jgi:hypothetical protein|uniref:Uncharacterized protein n=1 Tax=Caldovatus sediminis TaxID=2041189 RepID=A0A8J3ED84_9PROT|nr:hypothetical protein [Caldovatus sediminis]GGG42017.1 hypothetical protein GCM10010964_31880 [Caldovatus sediminis]
MRSLRACAVVLPLLTGGACTVAPAPSASLPPDAIAGAGDGTRAAILGTATAFATPAMLANRPDEAARAVAQLEFLAVEVPHGPRWSGMSPNVATALVMARNETRAALGIAPAASPQAVIDQLYSAARALRSGDRAAAERSLSPEVFQAGGAETLRRLAALPPLPSANNAAVLAQFELDRLDRLEDQGGGPGDGAAAGRS